MAEHWREEVSTESLVAYFQKMQLDSGQGDQVSDSREDIQYNRQLLRRRSLSHSESPTKQKSGGAGVVDLETCSHVIRLWVKDVRDRSNQLEDARQENRRLAEKERQLQNHSEEQLRALQSENSSLLSQLHQVQQQVGRVEVVERKNSALAQSLKEEENKSHEMREKLARARRKVEELRGKVREREVELKQTEKCLRGEGHLHRDLMERLKKQVPKQDAAVQTAPPTPPPSVAVPHCSRLVGGVVNGVTWGLLALLLLWVWTCHTGSLMRQ